MKLIFDRALILNVSCRVHSNITFSLIYFHTTWVMLKIALNKIGIEEQEVLSPLVDIPVHTTLSLVVICLESNKNRL